MKKLNKDLFQNIIHYFLQAQPNMYMAKLHKLLYFLEFNFLERNEQELLKEDFLKNKFGPTSINLRKYLNSLIDKSLISSEEDDKGITYYYSIKSKEYNFDKKTLFELDKIKEKYLNLSTKKIADLSHQDMPYLVTDEQQIINKQSAFFREQKFSVFSQY